MSTQSLYQVDDQVNECNEFNIQEIITVTQGKKICQTLLQNTNCITLSFRRGLCASRDTLVLVALISYEQSTCYIWDLHQRPQLVIEGGLARLLQAVEIVKIVHDAYREVHELHKKFGIHWHSIFDTYLAFQGLLFDAELPRRKISVKHLYHKLVRLLPIDEKNHNSLDRRVSEELDMAHLDWTQRPLKYEMISNLTTFTLALEQCYKSLRHLYSPFFNYSDYSSLCLVDDKLKNWWSQRDVSLVEKSGQLCNDLTRNGISLAEHCQPLASGAPFYK